jgi:leucyl/phenylalanyl-tRNA--protein transferase
MSSAHRSVQQLAYANAGQCIGGPRFSEPLAARLRRWALGTAYALQPNRIALMPRLAKLTALHFLKPVSTRDLLRNPKLQGKQGLLGISNDLSVGALLAAYKKGVFPVCHIGPMKWWSPAERAVLFFENAHVEKGVRKRIRQGRFDVTFDKDFAAVMKACADPRAGKTPLTWLTPRIMDAFWDLHQAGYAHSVEVWDRKRQLVGGIFGIAIGGVFFGESQFSRVRDASKIASAVLNCHLEHWGFALRDAKWMSGYLAGLGFTTIDRDTFERILEQHVSKPGRVGFWEVDKSLDTGARTPDCSPTK